MKYGRRWLMYLVAGLPVIVVAVAWARSYLPRDSFIFSNDGRVVLVFADGGRSSAFVGGAERSIDLDAQLVNARTTSRFAGSFLGLELLSGPVAPAALAPGFGSAYRYGEYRILMISYVWVFILAALLSGGAIYLVRRTAIRSRDKLCKACGYDLRASTDRCPECGTIIPVQAPAA